MTGKTDAPIYLLCFDRSKKENLWYVIEEKEKSYNYEPIEERISNMKLTDEGWIKTIHESETDTIRPLRLPAFSPPLVYPGHLAVSNSHVYIYGGRQRLYMAADNNNLIFYDYSSLSDSTWEECPYSKHVSHEFTLLNNGSIHTRAIDRYENLTSSPGLLLEPKPHLICSDWREFPEIQFNVKKENMVFKFGNLLAITDTKIYWIADVRDHICPWVICFDLQKWKWEIFDKKSFIGHWRHCVLLYDNYLFLCGTPNNHGNEESLFVYDLKRRQWLPYPLPFFDKFVEFLPDCSGQYNKCPKFLKVCDNKFAVVWKSQKQPYVFAGTKVSWTKFIIHKDFSSCDNPFRYQFRVELYSHGVCDIMGSMLNTAAEQTVNCPQYSAILKLNGTNHKSWVQSLMTNLAHMEIDLALREDPPPKPSNKTTVAEINYHRDWKYSNRCCLRIISYHMEDSIRDCIPKTKSAKVFLKSINKKYGNFSKKEKSELLSTLHSIIYDGKSGVGEHIDKVVACYRKMKEIGLKLDDDYIVWIIMHKLPSQFDSVRARYNALKEQWSIEEMTTILVKEEVEMYMAGSRNRWLG